MSNPLPADRNSRLYFALVDWFEEQIHSGALQPGDRLPPERKLGEQFGISRTVVREALRALAARGLIESHVGRGTFVRLPAVEHFAKKLRILHEGEERCAAEALLHVAASLAQMAAERRSPEVLAKLRVMTEHGPVGEDAFLHCLGEAAQNPILGTLARALAQVAAPEAPVLSRRVNVRRVVACIADGDSGAARQEVLAGGAAAKG